MNKYLRIMGFLALFGLLMLGTATGGQAAPPDQGPSPTDADLIGQLQQETGGQVRISYHAGTGKVRFIGTDLERPIARPVGVAAEATPEQAARQFLASYGQLFGLRDPAEELAVMRERAADQGRSFVRFQQTHRGIPVLGGELIVQMDEAKNVISANGEVLPDLELNVVPTVGAEAARQRALALVAKSYGLRVDELTTTEPELWIYNPVLLGGPGPRLNTLVWRMDVEAVELLPIRELVLVDAHRGIVALHFNQIDTAKNRIIYDHNNTVLPLPGITPVCTEGSCPGSGNDYNYAYDYAGDTYDFYNTYHSRDSIDNAGMTLISTVRYCPDSSHCPYANAFWNSSQMVYGDGYASADDVVGHEMTHGVTEHESHLFYYMQSGAINEAFSDIWGEFIDQTNGAGNDSVSVKWLMGEDLSGGASRNMKNPPAFSDPDKMSSAYYYCGESDSGGVHTNSGVANKVAYLMVDGDTFNGKTVTGLGITKVAKIFYEVQTNLFTSASDYNDLYDGLIQACVNLGYSSSDCQEVKDAVDATEMNQQPTSCAATEAPICTSGSPTNLFYDDLENIASGNWITGTLSGGNLWYYPQNPNPYSPDFDATYATSGQYNFFGDDPGTASASDSYIAMTSDVALPAGSWPYLHFNHSYAFADYYATVQSGGVVEYSTDGGSSWADANSLFINNGYNATIGESSNPLNGREAFGHESNGYISSRLSLLSLAGQNVRFRFRIGSNTSNWGRGWYIDDIRVYTCTDTVENVYLPVVMKDYTPSSSGWVTILSEDFEGSFPGSWSVFDNQSGYGEYYWGKRTCRAYAGSYSGWGVGGGVDGAGLSCGSNYPDNADSWMAYGPFSLVGATAGDLSFKLWLNSESSFDYVCRMASTDGTNFSGTCTSGNSSGWVDLTLDLTSVPTLGNLMGQSNVWVALVFSSDSSVNYAEGGYVDDIVLRKYISSVAGASPAGSSEPSGVGAGQIVETPAMMIRGK